VRFLVDNQLPVALARFLSSAGSDSQHVLDAGLSQASDSEIWLYAAEHHLVLISKDEDFFHRAARPGVAVQLVWIRMGNCRKADLLAFIERTWPRVCACLEAGERIVEIR
jgi:predicted nuclease of predicted toxin-antitoxin system